MPDQTPEKAVSASISFVSVDALIYLFVIWLHFVPNFRRNFRKLQLNGSTFRLFAWAKGEESNFKQAFPRMGEDPLLLVQ